MGKTQFINGLVEGELVDDVFSVKLKKPPVEYKKGYRFELRVSDRTGIIPVKYWGPDDFDAVESLYASIHNGLFVKIRGRVNEYNDQLEISVGSEGGIYSADDAVYDLSDFVQSTERDIDQMMGQLNSYIRQVEDPYLSKLLRFFFGDEEFVRRFRDAPASIQKHSNCIGGLLEHTLTVVEVCAHLQSIKPRMDLDLLIAGAILHDIGKMDEYVVTSNIDMSEGGMLMGHIFIGAKQVEYAVDTIEDFPTRLRYKVVHMVLSSHGKYEYGSPRIPQFPEAIALHYADEMDAKVEQCIDIKESARTDDDWIYNKDLGHVYLH